MKKGKIFSIFIADEFACTRFKIKDVLNYLKNLGIDIDVKELKIEMDNEPYRFSHDIVRVEKKLVDLKCDICGIEMSCISVYNIHMGSNSHDFKTNIKKYCDENNIEWNKRNCKKYSEKQYKKAYYNKNKDKYKQYYRNKKASLNNNTKI